jgi:hypothetical protein
LSYIFLSSLQCISAWSFIILTGNIKFVLNSSSILSVYVFLPLPLIILNMIYQCVLSKEPSYLSGTTLGYGLDDRGFESRKGLGIFFHHRVQTGSGTHPASYPMGTRGSFPGVKRPGREADHSPLSSAEIKNTLNYTSTPPIRLQSVVLSKEKEQGQT